MRPVLPERYIDIAKSPNTNKDDKFWEWQKPRNVIDEFNQLSNDAIKEKIKERALPFAIMMAQIEGDFNFGSLVRAANFLGASEIFYFGKKHWNRVGACGSYLYKDIIYLTSIEEIKQIQNKYRFVALENNVPKVVAINKYKWNKQSCILIGEEHDGIPEEILQLCDDFVEIPGRGSIRSLNAAAAGTLAMYDYINKLEF